VHRTATKYGSTIYHGSTGIPFHSVDKTTQRQASDDAYHTGSLSSLILDITPRTLPQKGEAFQVIFVFE
jgi:hypothetical protein